jgi:hypothetical protein
MKTQELCAVVKLTPFTLCFVEILDKNRYDEAITASEMLKCSYNPETQTSNVSIYAGTSLTYDETTSFPGGIFMETDDTRQTDT